MHPCQICFTIFFGIVILVGVILFAISFSIVDLNTVALKRNTYNRKIEEKTVYKPGRYFTGLAGEFIAYETTWQYINFSKSDGADSSYIVGKTSQNDQLSLDISVVFRLKVEQIPDLYKDYSNLNHKKDMINSAKESILEIVPKYIYTDFFTRRHEVSNEMTLAINKKFKNDFFSEVTLFLLKEVILESRFEDKIISQLVKEQEIKTQTQENIIKVKEGQLAVIESETQKLVDEIINKASSEANTVKSQSIAKGDGEVLEAEAKGYSLFRDESVIGTGNAWSTSDIVEFMNWQKFISSQNVNLYMGISDTARVEI